MLERPILSSDSDGSLFRIHMLMRCPTLLGSRVLDLKNRSVDDQAVKYEAPFKLEINKAEINRLNNTVKLDGVLMDTRFNTTMANVNKLSGKTSDVIDKTFLVAPKDIFVLVSLPQPELSAAASRLLGTTDKLALIALLVCMVDSLSTNLLETIIFTASIVIDPSAENRPFWAFQSRPADKVRQAANQQAPSE